MKKALSVTININCSIACCPINIVYLTACAFIRSWWRCTFWMTSPMTQNQTKNLIIASYSLVWRVNQLGNTRFASFDISFNRLSFENACWIARQALRCQQAFLKPCLVNLISKDTHLVFSIYNLRTCLSMSTYCLIQNFKKIYCCKSYKWK